MLGVDPGGKTGWAVATVDLQNKTFTWKTGEVQRDGFKRFIKAAVQRVDYVVCEDFQINTKVKGWDATRNTSNDLFVAKMVGQVEFACFMYEKPCVLYLPSRKPVGYKKASLPYVKGSKHANVHKWDAMSHAALFISEQWGFL